VEKSSGNAYEHAPGEILRTKKEKKENGKAAGDLKKGGSPKSSRKQGTILAETRMRGGPTPIVRG